MDRPRICTTYLGDVTVVLTVHFEDNGQDFLEWDLNAEGLVVGCRPSQEWLWFGSKVHNMDSVIPGERLVFTPTSGPTGMLKYKVTAIERREGHV